ncbi:MAG: alpha-galactosidase [Acutalibacteraceae bacterium]
MTDILRKPDKSEIIYETEHRDAELDFIEKGNRLDVYITAEKSLPKFLVLRWNGSTDSRVSVLGDDWERSYGNLAWRGIEENRFMPWYFMISDGKMHTGYGVETGCNSFVSFEFDDSGITAWIDVRSGSFGVHLGGRTLLTCSFVCESYEGMSEFSALSHFCRRMCASPLCSPHPVYGGNNWYYAYGKSSREEILGDTRLQVRLSEGLENRPYMVIDDCWQINSCAGPWQPNEKFGDMKALAEEIKAAGARPGIWVRFLHDRNMALPDGYYRDKSKYLLDPTVPEVLEYIENTVKRIRDWGFELIKHDFSTNDIFESWGKELNGSITKKRDLRFRDNTITNAEIVLKLYRTILNAAGDTVIIGCNTVSHLAAGLVHLQRIGDDTSGADWDRTRKMGVNTLAFRLPQHKAFYDIDADCAGILGDNIPWELNRQWIDLLSKSGTPMFLSCPDGALSEEQEAELKKLYRIASEQKSTAEPLDWMWNSTPSQWLIGGKKVSYCWNTDKLPEPEM